MSRHIICVLSLALGLGLVLTTSVHADDPSLMGYWKFDGDALDSSGNDRHGTLQGSPTFGTGIFGEALQLEADSDYVIIDGYKGIMGTQAFGIAAWVKTTNTAIGQIMHWGADLGGARVEFRINSNRLRISHGDGNVQGNTTLTDGEWYHVAVSVIENARAFSGDVTFYVNGVDDTQDKSDADTWNITPNPDFDLTIGYRPTRDDRPFLGALDDVVLYDRVLTQEDVEKIMSGDIVAATGQATLEDPVNEATDVLRDLTLSWSPGQFAATHNVYLGTVFEDVNNANLDDPLGTLVSQGQDATSLDAGVLEFGQIYYWRVDEVNGAPDNTVFKGETWRFEVEPLALPITAITATASSSQDEEMLPGKTVDGSGLDELDRHSTATPDMWLSGMGDPAPSIQYAFDKAYKLHEMWVWNSNQLVESFVGLGAKDVTIETSMDSVDWTPLQDTPEFAQAPGKAGYVHNTTVDLGGAIAQYVRLTITSGYGMLPQYGLSEIRFLYVPTQAREPQPTDGDTSATVDVVLNWRAGREAAVHEVYLGTDSTDLALVQSAAGNSAAIGPLDYATTYYWQIVEVNHAEDPASYAGPVWRFSTPAYGVVDNFDQYDDDCNRIFFAWLDGLGHNGGEDVDNCSVAPYNGNGSGSIVGHANSPFAEQTIVYAGRQSMPIEYDSGMSETTIALAPQDWTASGLQSLSLRFYGAPGNTGQLYLKINNSKVSYQGLPDALQRQQWVPWNIDLASTGAGLSNVTSLSLGIEGASSLGMIYVDEIRLYPQAPETIEPTVPDAGDPSLKAYYEFEGNANDTQGNYPGTAEGEPTYTAGKTGQAISLDEVDDHVVHTFAQEALWPAYTVSLWVKTDLMGQDTNSSLFNNNSSSSDFQIEIDGNDNYSYNGTENGLLGAVSDNWVHIGVSCNGTQTDLYYNGLLNTSLNVADTNFGQLAVGINRGMANWFGGVIDEVKVYDRALSNAEVAGLAGIVQPFDGPFSDG
jgi:hypothetical protein